MGSNRGNEILRGQRESGGRISMEIQENLRESTLRLCSADPGIVCNCEGKGVFAGRQLAKRQASQSGSVECGLSADLANGLVRVTHSRYNGRMRPAPRRRTRPCTWCRKGFVPVRSSQEFCSDACRVADWREGRRAAPRAPLRACQQCGHLIGPDMRADAVWCSGACRVAAHRRRQSIG
jgi:hypothetical protein